MNTEQNQDMEVKILKQPQGCLCPEGYESTKMSDIAAEVGIGRTALHYYFRTKKCCSMRYSDK